MVSLCYFLISRLSHLFSVTDNDIINIFPASEIRQTLINRILIPDVQEAPLGLSEQPGVILDGITFGGSVDDREHLFEVSL